MDKKDIQKDKLKEFASGLFASETGIDALHIGRNFYLAEQNLRSIKSGVNRDPYALGMFLGEDRSEFKPSPAFIDIISRNPDAAKKKIFVNDRAEWLFLCGRNILEESIAKNPHSIKEGLVLVQNLRDENLGYGIFAKQGRDLVIKNLLDKGSYLRANESGRKGRRDRGDYAP